MTTLQSVTKIFNTNAQADTLSEQSGSVYKVNCVPCSGCTTNYLLFGGLKFNEIVSKTSTGFK